MFQVLLVDDEALARNDVKSMLDWEKHGFTLCGEALNGSMALTMLERLSPHIVLMDVSMPVMNGVELSRIIKERFPKVKMIMLSSFDDYDYVRACLMNGAMDYLLKHRLNAASLLSLLKKAAQDLEYEEREHEARNAQTRMLERISPVLHREFVANIARDVPNAGEELQSYARDNQLYANAVTYGTAAVQIVPFLLLTETLADVQKNRFVQQATDVMQMAIGDIHSRTVAYVGEGRFIVLFSSEDRSEHSVTTQMNHAMSSLAHSLFKFLNLKCIYTIGAIYGNIKQLGLSYRKADQEMNDMLYRDTNTSIQRDSLFMEEQKQLLLFLEQLDEERINQVVSTIFAALQGQHVYSMPVQMMVSEMLHLAEMTIKRHFPNASYEDNKLMPSRSELGRAGSIAELEEWVKDGFASVVGAAKKQHAGGRYSRHISQALQFIMEHYASDISLETTANAINLNASYLSRLFKEEMQMTFTEYLNRLRITSSCTLMESGAGSLKQISSQVGFLNHTYFYKVFKTITGMTPQAYLDRLKLSKK
jgi:two-component system, response regulator YesN